MSIKREALLRHLTDIRDVACELFTQPCIGMESTGDGEVDTVLADLAEIVHGCSEGAREQSASFDQMYEDLNEEAVETRENLQHLEARCRDIMHVMEGTLGRMDKAAEHDAKLFQKTKKDLISMLSALCDLDIEEV